uniref:SFRICE_038624 n=1 Tax=Spodoptera frugiperda TaxID=7108 RepID=A0A2H1VY69_SPOFR
MPHAHSSSAASSGGDDLGSTDEVKVFKDEGDGEDEKRSSENLLEEKSSLIDWTESELNTRVTDYFSVTFEEQRTHGQLTREKQQIHVTLDSIKT